jgi:hypothetical protein
VLTLNLAAYMVELVKLFKCLTLIVFDFLLCFGYLLLSALLVALHSLGRALCRLSRSGQGKHAYKHYQQIFSKKHCDE